MAFFKKLKPIKLPANYVKLDASERRQVRESYIAKQHGLCHYCESKLTGEPSFEIAAKEVSPDLFPENFFDNPVHLHHDHNSGLTIGAVHCHCNAVLWEHDGE